MVFTLARYKHVAKMLEGKGSVLEVGCGEGWKSRIVRQHVRHLTAIDGDPDLIAKAVAHNSPEWPIKFECRDALDDLGKFDAVYCLDLFEHISQEQKLLLRLLACAPVCIIGTPSVESQPYASSRSRAHHVNCKSGEAFRSTLLEYWKHVFMLTMHDETLGTSFLPMSQYLLALCVR
jgi:2-polyprenyl-3-methyl-5-hydroxy-6-metoxy-1,4-benzoquinol methylase